VAPAVLRLSFVVPLALGIYDMPSLFPRTQWQYQPELSEAVQDKISQLSALDKLLTKIESEFEELFAARLRLEIETTPYRLPSSPQNEEDLSTSLIQESPIECCPDDVLLLIFHECLNPRHDEIGQLLQVCKRWNHVVMNTPTMWARIQVTEVDHFFEDESRVRLTVSYVSACLERSCNLLLDVELNLMDIPSCSGYIESQARDFLRSIVDEVDHEEVDSVVYNIEWTFQSSEYETMLQQAFDGIFGRENLNLKRWKTLSLTFPHAEEIAMDVWRKFKTPCPSLKIMKLQNVDFLEDEVDGLVTSSELQALASVTHLDIKQKHSWVPLEIFTASQSLLEVLETTFISHDLPTLALHVHLHTLVLVGSQFYFAASSDSPPATLLHFSLHLPRLKNLTIGGNYEPLKTVELDFPILENLTIRTNQSIYPLPKLSPACVRWQVYAPWEEGRADRSRAMYAITTLITVLTHATCLIVPDFAIPFALILLLDNFVDGQPSLKIAPHLTQIVEELESGDFNHFNREEIKGKIMSLELRMSAARGDAESHFLDYKD
jgi:hypothetical protein